MLFKRCEHDAKGRLTCEHPWWVQIKRRPYGRIRESLERYFPTENVRGRGSKRRADDLEKQFVLDVKSGVYAKWKAEQEKAQQPAARPEKKTWSEFCDFYIQEHIIANKLRWDHTLKYKMERIREAFGDRPIDSIGVADVQAFVNTFKKRNLAAATVKYYYSIVSTMFKFAAKMEWIQNSPLRPGAVELAKVRNERTRRLSLEEEDALLSVLTQMEDEPESDTKPARRFMKGATVMTLDTGLRRGSILALQFKMVKWNEGKYGVLDVPAEVLKQRRPQQLALTDRARKVLDQRRRFYFAQGRYSGDTVIFGRDDGTAYTGTSFFDSAWQEAKRRAGLKDADLHFHDLRGEAASRLSDMGMPLSVIQRFLGHSSLEMTQRYLRARVGEVEETAAALESYRATKGATEEVQAK